MPVTPAAPTFHIPGSFVQSSPANRYSASVVGPPPNIVTSKPAWDRWCQDYIDWIRAAGNVFALDLANQVYVSQTYGNDSNNGTTATTPFKTLAKVNAYIAANPSVALDVNLWPGDVWHEFSAGLTISSLNTGAKTFTIANTTTFAVGTQNCYAILTGGASSNAYDPISITAVASGTNITYSIGAGITVAADRTTLFVSPLQFSPTQGQARVRRWTNRLGVPNTAPNPDPLRDPVMSSFGLGVKVGSARTLYTAPGATGQAVTKTTSGTGSYVPLQGVASVGITSGGTLYGNSVEVLIEFGGGVGAGGRAVGTTNSSGVITAITPINPGIYSTAPTTATVYNADGTANSGTGLVVTFTMDGGSMFQLPCEAWLGQASTGSNQITSGYVVTIRPFNSIPGDFSEEPYIQVQSIQHCDSVPGSFYYDPAGKVVYFKVRNTTYTPVGSDLTWEILIWNPVAGITFLNTASDCAVQGVEVHGYGAASPSDISFNGYNVQATVSNDRVFLCDSVTGIWCGRHNLGNTTSASNGISVFYNCQSGGTVGDGGSNVGYAQYGGNEVWGYKNRLLFGKPGYTLTGPWASGANSGRGASGAHVFGHSGGYPTATAISFPGGASGNTMQLTDGNDLTTIWAPAGMPVGFPGTCSVGVTQSDTYGGTPTLTAFNLNNGGAVTLTPTMSGGASGTITAVAVGGTNSGFVGPFSISITGGSPAGSQATILVVSCTGEIATVSSYNSGTGVVTFTGNLNGNAHASQLGIDRPMRMFVSQYDVTLPGLFQGGNSTPAGNAAWFPYTDASQCKAFSVDQQALARRWGYYLDGLFPNLTNRNGTASGSPYSVILNSPAQNTINYGGTYEWSLVNDASSTNDRSLNSTEYGGLIINARVNFDFSGSMSKFQQKRTFANTAGSNGFQANFGGYQQNTTFYNCEIVFSSPNSPATFSLYKSVNASGAGNQPVIKAFNCIFRYTDSDTQPAKFSLIPGLGNTSANQGYNCYVCGDTSQASSAAGWSNEPGFVLSGGKRDSTGWPLSTSELIVPTIAQVAGYTLGYDRLGQRRLNSVIGDVHYDIA